MASESSNNSNSGLSLQQQLFAGIKVVYPAAEAKKINKDNFLDIYIPSVSPARGTHLFFNTVKGAIKVGYYTRDEDFINKVVSQASESIDAASNGLRIKGNPKFDDVESAVAAALDFLSAILNKKLEQPINSAVKQVTEVPEKEEINQDLIDAFLEIWGNDDLSEFLENYLVDGEIVVLTIEPEDFIAAVKDDTGYSDLVNTLGSVDMDSWSDLAELIGKKEANNAKKEYKDEDPSGIVLFYCEGKYVYAFSNPKEDSDVDHDELIEDNQSLKLDNDTIPQILEELNADKKLKQIEITYYINDYSDLYFGLIYKVNNCNVEVNRVNWYNDSYWTGEIEREDLIEGLTEYVKGNITGLELFESYIHADYWKFDRPGNLDNGVNFSITDLNGLTDIPKNLQDDDGELDVWELSNEIVQEEEDLYDDNKGMAYSYEFSINGKTYGLTIDRLTAVDNDAIMAARWKEESSDRITLLFDSLFVVLLNFHTRGSKENGTKFLMVEFENLISKEIIISNTEILAKVRNKVIDEFNEKDEEEWIERYSSAYEILVNDFNLVSEINKSLIKLSRMPEEDSGECDFSILSNLKVPLTVFPTSDTITNEADNQQVLFSLETNSEISEYYDSIDASNESFGILLVSKANLFGVLDFNGKLLLDCLYDRIVPINTNRYWCLLYGNWMLLDQQAKILAKAKYYELVFAMEGLCYAKTGNLCGVINEKGEEIIPVVYENILNFNEGITAVFDNGTYIFYNKLGEKKNFPVIERIGVDSNSGNWIINDGVINVRVDRNYCHLNTDGIIIGNYFAPSLSNYSNGFVSIRENNTRAIMDLKGNVYLKNQYDYVYEPINGLFLVIKDNFYGAVTIENKIIVPIKYDYLSIYDENLISCSLDGKDILYDSNGNVILDFIFDSITINPSENITESDKAWLNIDVDDMRGFYNLETKKIIECKYDGIIGGFDHGIVTVKKERKFGYLDTNGSLIGGQFFDGVACQEEDIAFKENFSYVKKGKKYAYLSIDGKLQTKFIYNSASLFQDGYAIVSDENELFGVIDTKFNYVVDCKYDSLERIGESKILFAAQYEGNYGVIDSNDNLILDFKFEEINPINNNLTICNLTKNFITKEIPFKEYHSENDADLNIVINIYGRMHQIFECINKEEEDIDAIEDHYQNIFDWKYKIDDDNLMIIELDGEKIFEGSILELAIRDDVQVYDLEPFQQNYIKSKLKKIKTFDEFHEFDSDDAWVSKKNYLLRIPQGRLEGDRGLELAPNFNNRYSMINYGKYHLKAFVKVKSFSISDLFFQMEPTMEDLISEPDGGPYYNFSKIFHYEQGELELEVVSENLKDTEFQNGWLYDF
jgi:hypothetical protein